MMGQIKFRFMTFLRYFSRLFMGYFSALSYGSCFLHEHIRGDSITDVAVVMWQNGAVSVEKGDKPLQQQSKTAFIHIAIISSKGAAGLILLR